jgi:hypothetical protein
LNPPEAGAADPDDEPDEKDEPDEAGDDGVEEDEPGESDPEVPVGGLALSAAAPELANPAPSSSRSSAAAASLATELSGFASDEPAGLLADPAALADLSVETGEPEPADPAAFPFDADLASGSVFPAAAGLTPSTIVSAGFAAEDPVA